MMMADWLVFLLRNCHQESFEVISIQYIKRYYPAIIFRVAIYSSTRIRSMDT